MTKIILTFIALAIAFCIGTEVGNTDQAKKINSACLIAREVQVDKTIIYCKPIAIMIDGKRQELKDGSVTTTDH